MESFCIVINLHLFCIRLRHFYRRCLQKYLQSFLSSYHIPGQVSTAAKFLQVKFLHSFYTILSQFKRILFWYMNYIKVREHQIMTNEQYYSLIQSYEDARKILISRLEILDHSLYGNHTESGPVHTIQSRIKSKDSIEEKLKRSGKQTALPMPEIIC